MAEPKLTTRLVIQLGNGEDPEIFGHTCGANSWGVTLTNNLGDNVVLDCANPLDTAAAIVRHLESQDTSATISGTVAKGASFETWRMWADGGTQKTIKLFIDEPAEDKGGFWTLPAFLQQYELTKQNTKTVEFSATISGAGRRIWTDAA
ncbi:hypothetical protein [Phaeobacter sp. NW0010-22]|uniref:hypothetical protein n=1 Tax=Phaeobacter sp. NW0010-22 TaxID=3135907 RepID=UPI00333FD629